MQADRHASSGQLLISGGRVIDPASGLDGITDVMIRDGRVVAVGTGLERAGSEVYDASGLVVAPGLIDFHTHVYHGGTSLAVSPDEVLRISGATTQVDAGTSGASNFPGFRDHVIARSPARIFAFLNISYAGIFAWTPRVMFGENSDLKLLDMSECLRMARENPETICGIKVRIGSYASGSNGLAPLDMALEVAEEAGLPVMVHVDYLPPRQQDVLPRLRPGDVHTHCCKGFPNSLLRGDGKVLEAAMEARARGVLFDVGHGTASFAFKAAEGLLSQGFAPDFISSDIHAMCIDGGRFHLLETLSKFLAIGMPLDKVLRAATATPAAFLRRPDIGSLSVGSVGDVTILALEDGMHEYTDVEGSVRSGNQRLKLRDSFIGGRRMPDRAAA